MYFSFDSKCTFNLSQNELNFHLKSKTIAASSNLISIFNQLICRESALPKLLWGSKLAYMHWQFKTDMICVPTDVNTKAVDFVALTHYNNDWLLLGYYRSDCRCICFSNSPTLRTWRCISLVSWCLFLLWTLHIAMVCYTTDIPGHALQRQPNW